MTKYYETAAHAIAASIALPIVDIFSVALKFWTRRIQKQRFSADDWFLIPATVVTIGIGITIAYGATHQAIGYPLQIPPEYTGDPGLLASDQVTLARKTQYAFVIMLPLALGSIKASFLFMYIRIFSIGTKTRLLLRVVITLVLVWTVAFFFADLFQCSDKFWANWGSTHDIRTQCPGSTRVVFIVGLTDFLIDLTIITIPIPLVWQLSLSIDKKFGVVSVFFLGAVAVAASLLRLIFLISLVFSSQDADANYRFVSITTSLYWGMIEAGVGIFAACLPTLQFLFRKNRWRVLLGRATPSQSSGAGVSATRSIYTNYTADAAYANKSTSPILTRTDTWVHHDRSEDGSDDIEMQESGF